MQSDARVIRTSVRDLTSRQFDIWFYARSRPVLIEDGALDWRALQLWNFAYLSRVLGKRLVTVKYSATGIFDFNADEGGAVEDRELTASRALALMNAADGFRYYLLNRDIRERFPELLRDIETPGVLDATKRLVAVNLWVGGAGTKSALHYDSMDNLLVQVEGRKRVMLFPPDEARNLYPALRARYPHISRANVFEGDSGRFPLLAKARQRSAEITLMPGNAIYLPPFWWHAVESLDPSSSVNFWWQRSGAGAWLKQVCFPEPAQALKASTQRVGTRPETPPEQAHLEREEAAVSPPRLEGDAASV